MASTALTTTEALYYHKLGTPQSEDRFIIRGEDKRPSQHMFGFDVSDECVWPRTSHLIARSGRYLELTTSRDTARSNLLWYADISKGVETIEWQKVVDEWGGARVQRRSGLT